MENQISVIVTAFNEEKYIGRCLRSLLSQNFHRYDYEIIIINDCSEDKTEFAIKQFISPFEEQIKLISNSENRGLPYCLNLGIQVSNSKYIVRVDGDDFVNENFLSCLHFQIETIDELDAVKCDYIRVDEDENIISISDSLMEPIGCGIIFRRDALIEIGLYDTEFRFNEERELMHRFKRRFKVGHIPLPLYRYRQHDQSMTRNKELKNHYDNLLNKKLALK
ncbi:glycosyltransferase [Amylibacter sp.]|nr:glycosyltransferase [Amylibacter sp.]